MGGLKKTFDAYVERWMTAASIQHEPEAFAAATSAVLGQLTARIAKENAELYPMVDASCPKILEMLLKSR